MTNHLPAKRKEPALRMVKVGERMLSTRGWQTPLGLDHLGWHLSRTGPEQWCSPACISKVMWGDRTAAHQKGARRQFSRLFRAGLEQSQFVVIHHDLKNRGMATALKIYNQGIEEDRERAELQLKRMQKAKQVSQQQFDRAWSLLHPEQGG